MGSVSAILFLAGLCAVLAAILAAAHKAFYVWEDPRIEVVTDMLPGANCGACGLPGCRAFAERVIEGDFQPGQCPVGGADTAGEVASYLGIEVGSLERRVARLLCAGGSDESHHAAAYQGFSSCRAAATIGGGFKGCTYGCLGLADCEVACTFDAIHMAENGLPVVDLEACTACGDCVDACPKDLFEIMPVRRRLVVQCRSLLEGDAALDECRVACTACARCVADAPEGLLHMESGIPVMDPEKEHLESRLATLRCPTGAIVWLEGQQFPELTEVADAV
ncbi:MAG: RnfABCDGE type electron transport complex subunit B [Rhodothermales bacterium]|nr:RnfABCDGE type electron transport complex subunit B [Rhodothermales bacterium]